MRGDSLIFLLGAGASVDAGIKHARDMSKDIEEKILTEESFREFRELYNYLKSSIIYQRGLEGEFESSTVTIEELLDVMSEINQKHVNRLYPFIGAWNIHLQRVAGSEFSRVGKLDDTIRGQLFRWMNIPNYDNARYLGQLGTLAREIGTALRVFSLNYDLCIEKGLYSENAKVELGFNEDRRWRASRFEANENVDVSIYLYKLHGSIDWKKSEEQGGALTLCDGPQPDSELIFGATAKLRSIDPYLFYVHELRKHSLDDDLRLIAVVGYSFSDAYINGLLGQALAQNEHLRILWVGPLGVEQKSKETDHISRALEVGSDRIIVENATAREFLSKKMSIEYFSGLPGLGNENPF